MPKKSEGVVIPADLSTLSDAELSQLHKDAVDEFDRLSEDDGLDATGLAALAALADNIDRVKVETDTRTQAREELEAQRAELKSRVHPAEPEDEGDEGGEGDAEGDDAIVDDASAEPALVASGRRKTDVRDVLKSGNKLNVRLSQAQRQAPQHNGLGQFGQTVIVASGDIPGYTPGSRLEDGMSMVKAFQTRSRALAATQALRHMPPIVDTWYDAKGQAHFGVVGHEGDWRTVPRYPVAQLQREYRYKLDDTATPEQAWEVMQAAANPEALVAAGGWCSPSEVSYDFYNIVAEDGGLMLPTTGIRRGGMRWPTSPSFGDLASSTGLWHWTETQDIAAATGTGQSGTKTCARVPCAAFNEARLEGEGVCITAGNLTTDAWPEQIANFMRLVNAAHFHRVNSFFINQLIANSTGVTLNQTASTSPTSNLLADVELQVWDLRTKYAMADTAIVEAVFPSWVMGIIRADLSRRKGWDSPGSAFAITNAEIAAWFTSRGISAQFVQDFDVRAANQLGQSSASTAWPTQIRFLLYPAGTWVRGNGLTLDLGVIRDSTLNSTNDYTAAWSEEFFLLAKIGHESRVITTTVTLPTGATGSDVTVATGP